MNIKKLPKNYIQKSRIFMYPLLSIRRGVSVVPKDTYMSWDNVYKAEDCKLICNYHIRTDREFKIFEEVKLLGNDLFEDYFTLEDGSCVYVFDFSKHQSQHQLILAGQYSKLNTNYKKEILNFFKNNISNHTMIKSYLYPDKYYKQYAKLYDVTPELLADVKELCSKPDFEKETFKIKKKNHIFDKDKTVNQ